MKSGLAAICVFLMFTIGISMFSVIEGGAQARAAQNADCDPPGEGTGDVATGPARLPVVGAYKVTSDYGWRVNPGSKYKGQYMLHAGIDLAETPGEGPIVAAMGGKIRKIYTDSIGTNIVSIDVGGGVVMNYLHLSSFQQHMKVGQKVWAGKEIGIEGATGNVSGPHLHFEVVVDGNPVEPRAWMAKHNVTIPKLNATGTAPPPSFTAPITNPTRTAEVRAPNSPVAATPGELVSASPVGGTMPKTVGPYKGQQVVNAAYIIKAGQALHLDAWSITVGVMTAMGESTLNNISHGDKAGPDSVGLFQQRGNGAWGSYKDRMNPTIASTNFFKALKRVPGYHSMTPTHAAHAVQGNQDPEHYTPNWPDAVVMIATLTQDPSLLKKLPVYGPVDGGSCGDHGGEPAATGTGAAIVAAARKYIGTPYSWGGGGYNGPTLGLANGGGDGSHTVGFDCSGLVMYAVYRGTGIKLPHSADADAFTTKGQVIPRDFSKMRPGDVVAFSEDGSGARGSYGHVAIYIGEGRGIEAPVPGKNVREFDLKNSTYYKPMKWSIHRFANASGPSKTAQAQ